jgi:hypothetical protein
LKIALGANRAVEAYDVLLPEEFLDGFEKWLSSR